MSVIPGEGQSISKNASGRCSEFTRARTTPSYLIVDGGIFIIYVRVEVRRRVHTSWTLTESISLCTIKACDRSYSPFSLMLASRLTYAMYLWTVLCKCALVQTESRIFFYYQIPRGYLLCDWKLEIGNSLFSFIIHNIVIIINSLQ